VRIWNLFAAVIIAGLTGSTLFAQNGAAPQAAAAPAAARPIVVIDVGYILKNHPTMKSEMESIQASMEAADKEMADKRDGIVKQLEQLREQYTEGTPEYDRAEKAIAEQDTSFRLELVKKRKEFETAQANVLYRVYTEMNYYLNFVSQQWGTQLVLRVNREKMDPKKPETIQLVMSQDVIYFNENIDLTNWLLGTIKDQAAKTASGKGAALK
jgi:Skp family chaperone for outer membrane proteins